MLLDCGIDIGSTNLKVVLIDCEGRTAFVRSVPAPRSSDGIGAVTDAAALVVLLEELIIEGWRQCAFGQPLRSITVAGVGEDGLGVRADLTPTGPSIPWFDRRADGEAAALSARWHLTARTGIAIAPDRTVAKFAWLRRNRAEELDQARYWIALTDYPAVWWTGRPFMSISLAPRTACFDIPGRQWVEPMLEAVGAPPLPPVTAGGTPLGSVRGGPLIWSGCASSRTVVAAGGHDHPVAASAFTRLHPGAIIDSLGTANLLYGELEPAQELPSREGLAFSIPPADNRRIACLGVLELSKSLPAVRQQDTAFRSFLANPSLPGSPPRFRGDLDESGPNPRSLRRALERVTLEARQLLTSMQDAGVEAGDIYTSGGWSRSRGFTELRASIFGRPINVADDVEMTAIGAALFGAMAAGASELGAIRSFAIERIDPVADWVPLYDKLFSEFQHETVVGNLV